MEKRKEDVIGCMIQEAFEVDIGERGEGEETNGLVWGRTGSEYTERLEEGWVVG